MTEIEMDDALIHEQLEGTASSPQSPFETLRAKRDEVAAKTDVLIPLGSAYDDIGLHAKYRLITRDEADEIAKNVKGQTKDRNEFMFRVLVDTMIRACEGFFLKHTLETRDEDAEPLMTPDGSSPVLTYHQLAEGMKGEPFTNHRSAVIYVFGDNEFTVGQHGVLLNRWFSNTGLKVNDEFLEG